MGGTWRGCHKWIRKDRNDVLIIIDEVVKREIYGYLKPQIYKEHQTDNKTWKMVKS